MNRLLTITPVRFFVPLSLFFGAILVFITPPFQSPDEYNHFFRAFQVSKGRFYPETLHHNRLGGYLPASLDSLKHMYLPLKGDYAAKTDMAALRSALSLR
ncbi:MAG: DUF2142 domain-containing protein, partial [Thermoanaerobaculia bacterium]|nr:DUF2142 domain-containing protein [Thermoanaerobaculia bacterium]